MKAEAGSATVAMTGAIAMIAFASVAIAGLGSVYATRTQAQVAADAAALAAAVATYPPASQSAPHESAKDVARRNGATLIGCSCPVDETPSARVVEVVTAIAVDVPVFGDVIVRASSRAEFDPWRWLGR